MMDKKGLLREMNTAIIRWYPFTAHSCIFVPSTGRDDDPLEECRRSVTDHLTVEGHRVVIDADHDNKFDYIILIGILEYQPDPVTYLERVAGCLGASGRLLIVSDNRFGLRYFCGDHDLYTDRSFDGIEDYDTLFESDRELIGARSYSRHELTGFITMAGFDNNRFYSVFPDIRYAQLLYSEDYEPNEQLVIRYQPYYNHPESVFLSEGRILNDLSDNQMLHTMADGYLIECAPLSEKCHEVYHVTLALDRGDDSIATVISGNRMDTAGSSVMNLDMLPDGSYDPRMMVEKIPMASAVSNKLNDLIKHSRELTEVGIKVIPACVRDGHFTMPYITATGGMDYFINLARCGREELINGIELFYQTILNSSEQIQLPADTSFGEDAVSGKPIICKDHGPILRKGYVDMMPLNCFVIDNEFYFYDQEFVTENYPAKAILYRAIRHIFSAGKKITNRISLDDVLELFGLKEDRVQWERLSMKFITELRNLDEMHDHIRQHTPGESLAQNRERISFSVEEYRKWFTEALCNLGDRDIVVFGTGRFAKRFASLFKDDLNIRMFLDNEISKQGGDIDGIPICSPDNLINLDPESYKLIICIRHYVGVLKQIRELGVINYGFFNPDADYSLPAKQTERRNVIPSENIVASVSNPSDAAQDMIKPYHIGYVAGVFDLFHIGHLNLLRRAKEQCDHLIVGVVGDASIRENKGTDPVVPLVERLKIVEACRYVDEAFELPRFAGDSMDMWRRFHFDVQFSGSDYENDPAWTDKKAALEKHGATIVFFPYTEETSTTKRKAQLKEKDDADTSGKLS